MIAGSRIPNTTTWSRAANIVQVHRPSILLPWRPIRQLWVISRLTILFIGFKYRVHRRLYTGAFLCLPNHIPALCPSMYDLACLNHLDHTLLKEYDRVVQAPYRRLFEVTFHSKPQLLFSCYIAFHFSCYIAFHFRILLWIL